MDRVLFSNRMGGKNLLYIGLGFAIAIAVLIAQGGDPKTMLMIGGGLVVVTFGLLAVILSLMGRKQVAELTQRDGTLIAEMVHIVGRGQKVDIPVGATGNWRVREQAGRSNRPYVSLQFDANGRTFSLPLSDAKRIDLTGLRALAPEAVDAMTARKLIEDRQ